MLYKRRIISLINWIDSLHMTTKCCFEKKKQRHKKYNFFAETVAMDTEESGKDENVSLNEFYFSVQKLCFLVRYLHFPVRLDI